MFSPDRERKGLITTAAVAVVHKAQCSAKEPGELRRSKMQVPNHNCGWELVTPAWFLNGDTLLRVYNVIQKKVQSHALWSPQMRII